MLNFILLNFVVLQCAYLLVKQYFKYEDYLDTILAFSVLFLSQIILTLTLLGSLNLLYFKYIILINLFILLVLSLSLFKNRTKKELRFLNFTNNFKGVSLSKVELFCLSCILGFSLVKIIINLVNPPFGWDSLNYHFTFPVEWLKHGNLDNPIVVNDYPAPTYYPINGSLFYFWLMLPFRSVFIADLGQFPFLVLAFLAILAIAKKIGINRTYAFFAAALFTITPNYFKQIEIAYVDIMVATLFLCSLNFIFYFYDNLDTKSLILFSLSAGLLLGTKILNVLYIPVFFMCLILFMIVKRKKINFKNSLIFICIFLLLVIALGGFSYLKNYLLTKNFFYPLDLKIFGLRIIKGVMTSSYPVKDLDFSLVKLLFHEGIGAGTILFVIPGLILALIQVFKEKISNAKITFLFLLIPILYLTYYYIIRLPNPRYLYSLLGICYVLAFFVLGGLRIPLKIINVFVVICFLASIAELAGHLELVISILVTLLLFFSFTLFNKKLFYFLKPSSVFIFTVFIFLSLFFLDSNYIANEHRRYETSLEYSGFWPDAVKAWIWLNNNTIGNNIAYVGRPVPFPLYGTHFKNNVYYVSVNETDPAMLHKYVSSSYIWGYDHESVHKCLQEDNNYRGKAKYEVWLRNLLRRNTDYLFIYSLHQIRTVQFPMEDEWANSHSETFDLVFKNDTIHIYKIRK